MLADAWELSTLMDLKGSFTLKAFCTVTETIIEKSDYFVQYVQMHASYLILLIFIVHWIFISTQFNFTSLHFSCQISHSNLIDNH